MLGPGSGGAHPGDGVGDDLREQRPGGAGRPGDLVGVGLHDLGHGPGGGQDAAAQLLGQQRSEDADKGVGYRIIFPSFNISVIRWLFAISFVILPANICKKCIPPSYLSLKVFLFLKAV